MGMLNSRERSASLLLRSLLLAPALAATFWASAVLPSFWRMVPARDAGARVIANDRFRPGTLAAVLTGIEAAPVTEFSQPELMRAKALLRLELAEDAMARKSSGEADREIANAEESVKAALAVSPGDAFLWLMLYSVETTRNGFDPDNIRYLGQSYYSGLHEGWISLRRNGLALAVFSALGDNVQKSVISEFAHMVDSDFIEVAASNLRSVGWVQRDRLLAALEPIDILPKEKLAKMLARDGIKVAIPGVEMNERPW